MHPPSVGSPDDDHCLAFKHVPASALLFCAISVEVVGSLLLRASDGFSRPLPATLCLACYALAFFLLSRVLRDLDLGIVYAIWSGAGTAAIAFIGVLALGEPVTALKVVSMLLVIAGVVGLNLSA